MMSLPLKKRRKLYNLNHTQTVPSETRRRRIKRAQRRELIKSNDSSSSSTENETESANPNILRRSPPANWPSRPAPPDSSGESSQHSLPESLQPPLPSFSRPKSPDSSRPTSANSSLPSSPESSLSSSECSDSKDSSADEDDWWKRPLHGYTGVTVGETIVELLDLYVRHNLSKSCLDDILRLINKLLPRPNLLPGNKYKLVKLLTDQGDKCSIVKHRFCTFCEIYLGLFEETLNMVECESCHSQEINGVFVEIPLKQTLTHLLESQRMFKHLCSRHTKSRPNIISDIVDGDLSRSNSSSQFPIDLMWNTDGVPVFHSSNAQIWPILFTISNVPPNIRKQNICLAGLWFGHTKPVMNTFLRPFTESLRSLERDGLSWLHPDRHVLVKSSFTTSVITVDAKARSDMQGVVSCNGRFGCSFCEHEGDVVQTQKSHVLVYPVNTPPPHLRDKMRMVDQAQIAVESGRSHMGVTRPSCLSLVPSIDTAKSFVPDYMHAVAQGVVRQFFFLWFDSKNHKEAWYIGTCKEAVDQLLLQIKPPNDICRTPRSVSSAKHWKASEFRNWLLFYSPVCLENVLPRVYFLHWLLLAGSIYLLLQQEITREEILLSEHLLQIFCEGVEELYGKRHMSFNVHQLLHLGAAVRNWGPLWATSCFMFENVNGMLLSLIHGTQRVSEQIVNSTKMVRSLSSLRHNLDFQNCIEDQSVKTLGATFKKRLQGTIQDALEEYSQLNNLDQPLVYARVHVPALGTVSSTLYSRGKLRSNICVKFSYSGKESYGNVQCFVKNHLQVLAVVKRLKILQRKRFVHPATGFALKHFLNFEETNSLIFVECKHLLGKVIAFDTCIAVLPNEVEKNL